VQGEGGKEKLICPMVRTDSWHRYLPEAFRDHDVVFTHHASYAMRASKERTWQIPFW